tara:strand:+ start:432 stop:749 length:318 start_codon:yes stop_codon:yes gene_type:complete
MSTYVPVIFVSILYYLIADFVNKDNARYLLSGYKTMSEERRKKFDIENYLLFFKKFFKQQSVYSLLIFSIFQVLYDDKIAIIIYAVVLTIALIYLVIKSQKFYKN